MADNKKPIPENEKERLEALKSYNILDTLPEEEFDRLTKLASVICEVPITLVSLMDQDRQWFKSSVGIDATETPRDISFCQYAIMSNELFEIEDATKDVRFLNNPLVTSAPNIRFYAGQPLTDEDIALGTLCVISDTPKKLNETQKLALKILAQEVVSQLKLRKSKLEAERLEKFFDLSLDLICVAGTDGFFKKINPAFNSILGFRNEDLLGQPFFDFIHPDDIENTKLEVEKLANGIKTIDFQNRFKTVSGEYKTINWVSNPDINTGELISIGRDVTEKNKKIAAITESEARFKALFEESSDAHLIFDETGIIECNDASIKMLACENKAQVLSIHPAVLSPEFQPDGKKSIDKAREMDEVAHKNGFHRFDWIHKKIDGIEFPVEVTLTPITLKNKPALLVVWHDITEREKTKIELEKAILLAEKNALAKDTFLANMSHEIRTPMNAILGFTEFLSTTKLDAEQKELVDTVQMAGENLLSIINDILDFSKIESGNLKLEKTPFNPKIVLENVKKLLNSKAKEKYLSFNFYVESEIPEIVLGDKVRLNQILINLVGNAIKFTAQGKVEVFCNVISTINNACVLEFKIKDTGIGIPKNKQNLVFERFKQADDNTTRVYGGTGLGLSICNKLVELHHGNISIISNEGKGSEFIVKIPYLIGENLENFEPTKNTHENYLKQIKVLLVEDNELNQKLARKVMEQKNINVSTAENGQIAIDILKNQTFDLIIMDLQMPVMDGYAATSFIRNILKIDTPIMAMTAHSLVGESEKCFQTGMNDYLSKPFKAADLIEKINHLTSKSNQKTILDTSIQVKSEEVTLFNLTDLEDMSGGDQDFICESLAIFLRDAPIEIEKMKKSLETKNVDLLKKTAHRIKPSYGLLGANLGFELSDAIETGFDLMRSTEIFNQLEEYTVKLCIELKVEMNIRSKK